MTQIDCLFEYIERSLGTSSGMHIPLSPANNYCKDLDFDWINLRPFMLGENSALVPRIMMELLCTRIRILEYENHQNLIHYQFIFPMAVTSVTSDTVKVKEALHNMSFSGVRLTRLKVEGITYYGNKYLIMDSNFHIIMMAVAVYDHTAQRLGQKFFYITPEVLTADKQLNPIEYFVGKNFKKLFKSNKPYSIILEDPTLKFMVKANITHIRFHPDDYVSTVYSRIKDNIINNLVNE